MSIFPSSSRPSSRQPRPRPPVASSRNPFDELADLVRVWRAHVGASRVRAFFAAGTLLFFAGFLLARGGTLSLRALGVAVLVAPVALSLWIRVQEEALWRDPPRVIDRLAGRIDPELAGRAIRALGLSSAPGHEGTSRDLAELHVGRSLRALPRDRILARAIQLAGRYGWATLLLAAAALFLAATRGFDIFEGADVMLATRGRAPVPIRWLGLVDVGARPPEYLHSRDMDLDPYDAMALPRGSLLTFRGVALHAGRRLLLSDGASEVPFVDDGTGHVVARWALTGSASLRIEARFGDVAIVEPAVTPVASIDDELPIVNLDGAPRVVRLTEVGIGATIPIKYETTDDHGLREVQLVLRSGAREDRRVLARLDGETQTSRGGHVLRANDPFIQKSHAPVEIRVEAQDNDAITGPKWGASDAITLVPPEAGEPEALRLDVLRALRDGFVDSLAGQMDRAFTVKAAERTALAEADRQSVAADDRLLDTAAKASPAGLPIPGRVVALLKGQMRRVKEALNAELRAPGSASHGRLVAASERLVLVTDAVTRGTAQADARKVARSLADVADDLSLGAAQLRRSQDRARGQVRADSSVLALQGGSRSLLRLGSLGRDLGEIVEMDLGRVGRARDEDDLVHAEIAASDLAARLRDPDPSFGARGGSGGRAGGESGGGRGTSGGNDPSDDADQQALDESAQELDRLKSDHAEEIKNVEEVMKDEESKSGTGSDEAKSHARAIRDATRSLPSVGGGTDSWTNKGAAAREHAEAMARALEEGDNAEAVASGRSALDALDEAKGVSRRRRWTGLLTTGDDDADGSAVDKKLQAIKDRLEPELSWATEQLKSARKQAALGKMSDVMAHGQQEGRLAERAGALREQGEGRGAFPAPAIEALHQAERAAEEAAAALKRGDVNEGIARQREAQRRLEAARELLGEPGDGGGPGHTEIPNAATHKGPDEFRKRVVEGLGQDASGRQKDAIRRYADGLLR